MKRFIALSLTSFLLLSSCQSVFLGKSASSPSSYDASSRDSGSLYADSDEMEASGSYDMVASTTLTVAPTEEDQKIIKTGTLDLHVDEVQATVPAIEEALDAWDGRVLYSSVTRGSSSYYADLQVRVGAEYFEEAMAGLKDMAIYVDSEYTNADDITEAYADLESRLRNAEEEEQAYLDILSRAGDMSDVLEVTRAIADVRYKIESYQTQLTNYDTRVAYSTIAISLSEDSAVVSITDKWRPLQVIKDAFGEWIVFLEGLVNAAVYALIFGWPLLLVWLWWRKRAKKKR